MRVAVSGNRQVLLKHVKAAGFGAASARSTYVLPSQHNGDEFAKPGAPTGRI